MSGSKKTSTTESQNKPWEYTDSGVKQVVDNTNSIASDTSLFTPTYGDTTRKGVSDMGALGQQQSYTEKYGTNVGQQASDSFGTGNQSLIDTASGKYTDVTNNSYLNNYLDASARKAGTAVNQSVSGAGRYGSGMHNSALATAVGDIYSQGYSNAYDKERQNQLQASSQLQQGGFDSVKVGSAVDSAQNAKAEQTIKAGSYEDYMTDSSKQGQKNATEWQSKMLSPYAQAYGTQSSTSTQSTPANTLGMIAGGLTAAAGAATGNAGMAASGFGSLANSAAGGSASTGYSGGNSGSSSNNGSGWSSGSSNNSNTSTNSDGSYNPFYNLLKGDGSSGSKGSSSTDGSYKSGWGNGWGAFS